MSNYTTEANSVRVDIFKGTGMWYDTVSVTGAEYKKSSIHESVEEAFYKNHPDSYKGMTAVCLEPYHEHAHPVMFTIK